MLNQVQRIKMNKLYLLILSTALVILGIGTVKAAWTVVYNPYTRQTTVVYVPDQPCPHNHYNHYNPYRPYHPYQPSYRPYGPTYQFNFNKHDNHGHKNHGGKNHGGGHGKRNCK